MEKRVRSNIAEALRQSNGRVYGPRGAAALLEMKPTTLASRIRRWGLGGAGVE
jgi:transcriptional regulator with GAF, ATPase, and Fis domain